jgi:hypothetical protein
MRKGQTASGWQDSRRGEEMVKRGHSAGFKQIRRKRNWAGGGVWFGGPDGGVTGGLVRLRRRRWAWPMVGPGHGGVSA